MTPPLVQKKGNSETSLAVLLWAWQMDSCIVSGIFEAYKFNYKAPSLGVSRVVWRYVYTAKQGAAVPFRALGLVAVRQASSTWCLSAVLDYNSHKPNFYVGIRRLVL